MSDELRDLVSDADLKGEKLEVSTTLDVELQEAANEAVRIGMQNVDRQLTRRASQAQVALIALDPRTGEVKALVGGRNDNESQLN